MINWFFAFAGVALGFSMAAPPGPINSIIMSRSMKSWAGGVKVGFGAMSADLILMSIIFYFDWVLDIQRFIIYVYILGAFLFAYIGIKIRFGVSTGYAVESVWTRGYFTGLTVGLMNPYQIAWWLTAGSSVYESTGIMLFIFFFMGIVGWILFITTLISYSYTRIGEKMDIYIRDFSFIVLLLFSGFFLFDALSTIGVI